MTKEELMKVFSAYLPYRLEFKLPLHSDRYYDLTTECSWSPVHTLETAIEANIPEAIDFRDMVMCQQEPFLAIDDNEIFLGTLVTNLGFELDDIYLNEVHPILYDLSFLTKEIEHEGKKFIPIVEILKKTSLLDLSECKFDVWEVEEKFTKLVYVNAEDKNGRVIDSMYYDSNVFWHMNNNTSFNPTNPQREPQELLLKFHFNTFDIPADQFINKATLTINKGNE